MVATAVIAFVPGGASARGGFGGGVSTVAVFTAVLAERAFAEAGAVAVGEVVAGDGAARPLAPWGSAWAWVLPGLPPGDRVGDGAQVGVMPIGMAARAGVGSGLVGAGASCP
jgi:hypothetical protein